MPLESALTSAINDGSKQYYLDGKPIWKKYYYPAQNDKTLVQESDRILFERENTKILTRRNQSSQFITKLKVSDPDTVNHDTQERITTRNELALSLADHPNFCVEVFVGERNGRNKYISEKIQNGFSFDKENSLMLSNGINILDACRNLGDLSGEELKREFDELSAAVKSKLNEAGYEHGDIHLGNLIYNPLTRKIMLVDFEKSRKVEKSKEYETINGWRDVVLRYFAKAHQNE